MVDHQAVNWVSTKPWIRSGDDTTGFRRRVTLKSGADDETPAQPVEAPEPGTGAGCASTMSVPRSKG
jgi:hypothetical protein